jgi:hypothetical protein
MTFNANAEAKTATTIQDAVTVSMGVGLSRLAGVFRVWLMELGGTVVVTLKALDGTDAVTLMELEGIVMFKGCIS